MFVKNNEGGFVNLETGLKIAILMDTVIVLDGSETYTTLYTGTEKQCQAYMAELEKELKAYGKLILVEVD